MGMFDSLMVKINDREVELQTKRFENRLGRYHPGDAVCGAPGGIGIYFDAVELDAEGRPTQAYRMPGSLLHWLFQATTPIKYGGQAWKIHWTSVGYNVSTITNAP
jgi:hypothetical protein